MTPEELKIAEKNSDGTFLWFLILVIFGDRRREVVGDRNYSIIRFMGKDHCMGSKPLEGE